MKLFIQSLWFSKTIKAYFGDQLVRIDWVIFIKIKVDSYLIDVWIYVCKY